MPPVPPRTLAQRIADTRRRLATDIDVWVATASPSGGPPALVPLSFDWDGTTVLLATERTSPAGRNMAASGLVRLGFGELRDVIMIDAHVSELPMSQVPDARWSAYAKRTGWDPRESGDTCAAYLATPETIQAWRESNELRGRTLMRAGGWLDATPAG